MRVRLPKSGILLYRWLSPGEGGRRGRLLSQPGPELPIVLMAPASRSVQDQSHSTSSHEGAGRVPPPPSEAGVCTSPSEERLKRKILEEACWPHEAARSGNRWRSKALRSVSEAFLRPPVFLALSFMSELQRFSGTDDNFLPR